MPDNLLYRLSSTRGQTHLSVKVNDVSQQIYAVRQTGSQETEAWIACESGQTYTVHLDCQSYPRSPDYRGNYPDLNAELRLDGVMTEELTSVYRVKDGVVGMGNVVWKGTYTRRGFRKPFIFSSPILTDPVANIDPNLTEPLGTIQVQVRRIRVSKPIERNPMRDQFKRVWFDLNVPENAKKGVLSNLTELDEPEPSLETLMYDIVAENDYDRKQPLATLTLRYASREVLMAKGIIPCVKKEKVNVKKEAQTVVTVSSTDEVSDADSESDQPVPLESAPPSATTPPSRRRKVNENGNPLGRPSKRRRLYQSARGGADQDVREAAKRLDEAYERDGGWVDLTGGDESD